MPSVSVIIAVYNGEKHIDASLKSIFEQTYDPIEIIVVDDGSSDHTAKIVQKYGPKVRYFFQPNRGQPSALNFGISIAKSSYIEFLDADDLHAPDKTRLQVEFLNANPHIDFVLGHMEQFFCPDAPSEFKKKWFCPPGISPGYMANEQQHIGLFIEWYMRAEEKGLIPQQVLRRRIHENNMGIHSQHSRLEYVQIVKMALKRRLCSG